jgi:hypothetical protein
MVPHCSRKRVIRDDGFDAPLAGIVDVPVDVRLAAGVRRLISSSS